MENAYDCINDLIKNNCAGKKFVHNITKDKYLIKGIERSLDQKNISLKHLILIKEISNFWV